MTDQPITIIPLAVAEISAVADLIIDQDTRHYRLDSRLRTVRSRHQIERALVELCEAHKRPFVALDGQGRVCGYARPAIWEIRELGLSLPQVAA